MTQMIHDKLAKSAAFFVAGDLLEKAIPFFILPILANWLPQHQIGQIAIFSSALIFFQILFSMGSDAATGTFFFKKTPHEFKTFISTAFTGLFIISILLILLGVQLQDWLGSVLSFDPSMIFYLVITAAASVVHVNFMTLLRVSERAHFFALVQTLKIVVDLGLSVLLIGWLNYDWTGRVYAICFTQIGLAIIEVIILCRMGLLTSKIVPSAWTEFLQFSFPILPHAIFGWALGLSDRILVGQYLGLEAAAKYSVAYTGGMLLGLFTQASNKALGPKLFELMKIDPQKGVETIYKYLPKMILILIPSALVCFGISQLFIRYAFPENYQGLGWVIMIINISYIFSAFYSVFVNVLFFIKKTKTIALITFVSASVNIILNLITVKSFGLVAVAANTLIAVAVSLCLVAMAVNRTYAKR